MRKIAVVVDSTTLLSKELMANPDVYVAPLSVIVNEQEYRDEIDLQEQDWINFLSQDATMTTSQPQTQHIVEILETIQSKDYDFSYILSLTSNLSGTLNAFNLAIEMSEFKNFELIDTFTIAGAPGYMAEVILQLNQEGKTHEEIMKALETPLHHNEVLIWPGTLNRLIKSGRMSKAAGMLGSLLKLNPILYFAHHMAKIEKLEIVRSDRKVIEALINRMKLKEVNAQEYVVYLLHVEGEDRVKAIEAKVRENFGEIEIRHNRLPGVIATHVGLKTVGVQYIKKVKNL